METLQKCALTINILGAINFGIVGLFKYNPLMALTGDNMALNIIYVVWGIAGLINIGLLFRHIEDKKIKSR